jgi:hypothetical protein
MENKTFATFVSGFVVGIVLAAVVAVAVSKEKE